MSNKKPHRWNAEGERCLDCGDKDWMAGPYCMGGDVARGMTFPHASTPETRAPADTSVHCSECSCTTCSTQRRKAKRSAEIDKMLDDNSYYQPREATTPSSKSAWDESVMRHKLDSIAEGEAMKPVADWREVNDLLVENGMEEKQARKAASILYPRVTLEQVQAVRDTQRILDESSRWIDKHKHLLDATPGVEELAENIVNAKPLEPEFQKVLADNRSELYIEDNDPPRLSEEQHAALNARVPPDLAEVDECPACNGTGTVPVGLHNDECLKCCGWGTITVNREKRQ